jgi:hypothetical protein
MDSRTTWTGYKRLNRETRVGKHPTKGFYFPTQKMMKFVQSPKFGYPRTRRRLACTANMYSGITVEVQLKNCTFERLQFFTVDNSSLYFLQVKNCNFSIIFNVVYFAWN